MFIFTGTRYTIAHLRLSKVSANKKHYCDVKMGAMASQITSLTIVYSTVHLGPDQRKHQSSASLAFVLGIHRSLVHSPHKGPVTRKMFLFDDVIMRCYIHSAFSHWLKPYAARNRAPSQYPKRRSDNSKYKSRGFET